LASTSTLLAADLITRRRLVAIFSVEGPFSASPVYDSKKRAKKRKGRGLIASAELGPAAYSLFGWLEVAIKCRSSLNVGKISAIAENDFFSDSTKAAGGGGARPLASVHTTP